MYKKIIILGGSGSGKSTLTNNIAKHTGYPIYHLDELFLESDFTMKDKTMWPEISKVFLEQNVGVVDGNYGSNLPLRVKWADLIIYIDISTWLQIYRILKRYFNVRLGKENRIGISMKSREKINLNFLIWVLNWNRTRRNKTLRILEEQASDKKVIIIHRLSDLDLEDLFN